MYDQPTDILPSFEPPETGPQKPSRLDTAALVVGILSILGVCGASVIGLITRNLVAQTADAVASAAFLAGACSFGISPLGIGLGVVSILQKPQNRTMPMLGLVMSVISLLILCVVILLGVAAVNTK